MVINHLLNGMILQVRACNSNNQLMNRPTNTAAAFFLAREVCSGRSGRPMTNPGGSWVVEVGAGKLGHE